jgi:uncharacterized protein YrrD
MPLRRTKDLHDFTIAATDADVGKVHDLYFDERDWNIRYIVVQMGELLPGRKVLISLKDLKEPIWMPLHIRVNLTSIEVETSPEIELHEPVSRQHQKGKKASDDPHLRSAREVVGYHLMATDGEIGHVEDFLFDDEHWKIRYAIIDTSNWWDGRRVLLRPQWIKCLSWSDTKIYVDMSRKKIRNSPEWDPNQPLSREYELHLHMYHGGQPYWTEDD